jgi:hypothetical protein
VRATFDLIVVVDWSAASSPVTGANSIWIATSDGDLHNPPTRAAAAHLLDHLLDGSADGSQIRGFASTRGPASGPRGRTPSDARRHAGRRVLVGVDVPFGYPAGTAALLGLHTLDGCAGLDGRQAPDGRVEGEPWRAMWSFLERTLGDDDRNRNDRFVLAGELNRRSGLGAGPFWGRPGHLLVDGLVPTKSPFAAVAEWRACELELRRRGHRPSSVWQLAYAGSVGGQALTAMPVLERLRRRHARAEVWPLTTGFVDPATLASDAVVLAEVWPSAFAVDRGRHHVKDAAQVLHVVEELATADRRGQLGSWFVAPDVPGLCVEAARHEEAWILGPPASH